MINVLIIEDEAPARKKLNRFLERLSDKNIVLAELESVDESVSYLKTNAAPDLIFSDIELRDATAFEIYNQVKVPCPIIFTTAYNQFLMDAFETNGIAYLLKPYSFDKFKNAWDKFKNFQPKNHSDIISQIQQLLTNRHNNTQSFKEQFPIKTPTGIYFLKTNQITYLQSKDGMIFAFDLKNKRHILSENSLSKLIEQLDNNQFFKINRAEIINKMYVEKLERYSKNIIAIRLSGISESLKTSQSTTSSFNEWMGI